MIYVTSIVIALLPNKPVSKVMEIIY